MDDDRSQVLQDTPIFAGIRDDILAMLLELSPVISVNAGEYFFREDELGGDMFVLEAGRVAILKEWDSRQYVLGQLATGDCFGEMSIVDMHHRSASVLALEDCRAIRLANSTIFKLYREDLEQFTLIQMNMAREISRRLRVADEHLFQFRVEAKDLQLHD